MPHLTRAEREARGKAARKEVPRSSHALYEPAVGRTDPIELLEFAQLYAEQNQRDYQALVSAVDSGRISAETGL